MRSYLSILLLLCFALAAHADNDKVKAKRGRGKPTGEYTLKLIGTFTGAATASVSDTTLSLSGTVKLPDGTSGAFLANDLSLKVERFSGPGTIMGVPCTVEGRVDLPDATDDSTSDDQAFTGRISATVRDPNGRMSKIIGIQDPASRGKPEGKGKDKDN